MSDEFCGEYKGTHSFEEGSNRCRCGRAYLRAPRPLHMVTDDLHVQIAVHWDRGANYDGPACGAGVGFSESDPTKVTCDDCLRLTQTEEKPREQEPPNLTQRGMRGNPFR